MTRAELARLAEDLRELGGADEATIARAQANVSKDAKVADPVFVVHPANGVAVRLFLATQTQWQVVGLSTWSNAELRRVGLDYGKVEATARLEGLEVTPDDFRRLRIMEAEALSAWSEASS